MAAGTRFLEEFEELESRAILHGLHLFEQSVLAFEALSDRVTSRLGRVT